jgi:hypothetical protein
MAYDDDVWLWIEPAEPGADYAIHALVGAEPLNADDDNIDVEVCCSDGTRWGATFFTLRNLQWIFEKNAQTGECADGLYFNCPDLVIVRRLDPESIAATVASLRWRRWLLRRLTVAAAAAVAGVDGRVHRERAAFQ